jgi:hypothetical protein
MVYSPLLAACSVLMATAKKIRRSSKGAAVPIFSLISPVWFLRGISSAF